MKKQNVFSDLLVLDFSRYLPGGYATQPFADWGSEVIKVKEIFAVTILPHDMGFRITAQLCVETSNQFH